MRKHTKEKTLQHVIDYAPDTVLVVAKDAIRVLNSTTMEVQSNVITNMVKTMNLVELETLLVESNMAAIQNSGELRKSKSLNKSPSKRAKPQTDTSGLKYPQLSLEQNDAIAKRISSGDLDEVAAIQEAQAIMVEVRDRAVCMVFQDELADQLKCEVFVVKGSVKKAKLVADEIKLAIGMSKNQSDPFAATSKMQEAALSPVLAAVEISRSDIMAVKMVGSGMFGEVFLANEYEHAITGEVTEVRRAVKTLRKGSNKKQRKEFCDEAAIQLEFKHKGLVEVTGVCMMQEPYLCLLEFMQFGDLQNVLQTLDDKSIELQHHEQMYILFQISDALKYMHDRRYVHMDLATRNILVGAETRIKVADFGLTRKYDQDQNGYRLSGKMKLPMLWTPPECFPPIVTCGVNRAARGDEAPFYCEKTDMWSFGVCIWEIATYGGTPYGKGNKLIETLKKVHEGARLEMPEGTRKGIVNLMNFAFSAERDNRPSFSMVSEVLQNEFQRSGAPGVRDIGNLINDGFEKRIQRQSATVSTIRRKASSVRRTGVAPKMSDVKEISGMGPIGEEEEPVVGSKSDVDIDDEIAADEAAAAPKLPKSMVSKWRKVRIMLPFFQMNAWVVTKGGKMQRKVDESKLADALEHHDSVDDAFHSDDSDDSEDEMPDDNIPTVVEEEESAESVAPRGRISSAFPIEDGFEGLDGPESSTPAGGDGGDGEGDVPVAASAAMRRGDSFKSAFVAPLHTVEESDDDDDEEEDDDGGVDDMAILELMAQRREQNAAAEVTRRAEIKMQYETRRVEEERILAIELAQFEEVKKKEHAAEEAAKEKLYQEAQTRLETELTFSFSWS